MKHSMTSTAIYLLTLCVLGLGLAYLGMMPETSFSPAAAIQAASFLFGAVILAVAVVSVFAFGLQFVLTSGEKDTVKKETIAAP